MNRYTRRRFLQQTADRAAAVAVCALAGPVIQARAANEQEAPSSDADKGCRQSRST